MDRNYRRRSLLCYRSIEMHLDSRFAVCDAPKRRGTRVVDFSLNRVDSTRVRSHYFMCNWSDRMVFTQEPRRCRICVDRIVVLSFRRGLDGRWLYQVETEPPNPLGH